MGTNISEEIDCGNLFDQIEDLMDFPLDHNDCGGDGKLVSSINAQTFPSWNHTLSDSNPFSSAANINSVSDLSAELSVPCEDILQLEWLSTFVEDSFSSVGLTIGKDDNLFTKKEPTTNTNQFQIPSPLSVLESTTSSSSSSGGKSKTVPPQRARSKRPRPATFNPIHTTNNHFLGFPLELDSFVESSSVKKNKARKNRGGEEGCKNKNKKIKVVWSTDQSASGHEVRKCLHCQITKTPQWRGGPLGPKTLCNACGVRYKSGRLFPEYRPAASPTFVPSLHSNSHKKVVEMRGKVGVEKMKVEEAEVVPNA